MTSSIQVAVVDDHPLFRKGVANTLSGRPDIDVVAKRVPGLDSSRTPRFAL